MFNDAIKRIMYAHNLNQQEFAKILGVSQSTVNQWILGKKKPSYDSIYLICAKFKVNPNTLFDIKK